VGSVETALVATTVVLAGAAVAGGLRRLSGRHFLHQWGGWSAPTRGTYPWSKPVQERQCLECNRISRRKVKVRR
jgi:hypothetical protein